MNLVNIKVRKKSGSSPGTFIFTGEQKVSDVSINLYEYDATEFHEKKLNNVEELNDYINKKNNIWINICGLHAVDTLGRVGEIFNIHPLVIEDILNVGSSPKIEDYENYLFIVAKRLYMQNEGIEVAQEQISFILRENILLTFHEIEGDDFNSIRERLRENKGRLRKQGIDYLICRLLDAMVDNYFSVVDFIDKKIEDIEDEIIEKPNQTSLEEIHHLRKELIKFKRATVPIRDILFMIERENFPVFKKSTFPFLRDINDHIKQILDLIENYREITNGLMEVYLSSASRKMNEIMKLLTIISTIFIPLTFIVGIYGMNFNTNISSLNMPELNWKFGYPIVLITMGMIAALLVIWFKRKKWM
ncbi:MAG: magnesium and cobalt transport protein CorA [Ignavibacteria bacterium CG2_30_36_16]|nr:magnesium/cobalt transporter CorA [Ignavibacteria bacterium]OIP58484.1 MAG: magnesium and cobalt transport protein CorA [Ignavibacteria bacterium CG2_30_36_16]